MSHRLVEPTNFRAACPLVLSDGSRTVQLLADNIGSLPLVSMDCNARHIEVEHSIVGYLGTSRGTLVEDGKQGIYHHRLDELLQGQILPQDGGHSTCTLRLLSLSEPSAKITSVELTPRSQQLALPTDCKVAMDSRESTSAINGLIQAEMDKLSISVEPVEKPSIAEMLHSIIKRLDAIELRLDRLEFDRQTR